MRSQREKALPSPTYCRISIKKCTSPSAFTIDKTITTITSAKTSHPLAITTSSTTTVSLPPPPSPPLSSLQPPLPLPHHHHGNHRHHLQTIFTLSIITATMANSTPHLPLKIQREMWLWRSFSRVQNSPCPSLPSFIYKPESVHSND